MNISSKRLFLDDLRLPHECMTYMERRINNADLYLQEWIIVRSFLEFENWIRINGLPELISFDHDLGANSAGEIFPSGMDCAKWLINYCLDNNKKLPLFVIHSLNPVGRKNIEDLLQSFSHFQKLQSERH